MSGVFAQQFVQHIQRALQYFFTSAITTNVTGYVDYREQLKQNPLKVFVAYDWDDRPKVLKLYDRLAAETGVEPFLDHKSEIKDIPLSDRERWEPILQERLQDAHCVMVCLSREAISNKGYFNRKEVRYILEAAKNQREINTYIVLVKLERCRTPKKYPQCDVVEAYADDRYEKMLKTIVNAREELKDARNLRYRLRAPRGF